MVHLSSTGGRPDESLKGLALQHDEAIMNAVAEVLDLGTLIYDKLLMQRKISDHGLGLRSMEAKPGVSVPSGLHEDCEVDHYGISQLSSRLIYYPPWKPSQATVVNLRMRWRCCQI